MKLEVGDLIFLTHRAKNPFPYIEQFKERYYVIIAVDDDKITTNPHLINGDFDFRSWCPLVELGCIIKC
jgi:hypothetical protein